jgi:uncharacterized protein (DUF2252 family)
MTMSQTQSLSKLRQGQPRQAEGFGPIVQFIGTGVRPVSEFDFRTTRESWERRVERGRSLRSATPRENHGGWAPAKDRPDPVEIVLATGVGRQEHLLPLRHARMAASPFGFFRGAAAVMASDLARTPSTGLPVVICGDAHVNNFGLYGTPLGDVVLDINDFDEVIIGPWEWDLKRLTASVNVLAREQGIDREERRRAVMLCLAGYRANLDRVHAMAVLDLWSLHAVIGSHVDTKPVKERHPAIGKQLPKVEELMVRAAAKARRANNATLLTKVADRGVAGGWRFKTDPPILTAVDPATREQVIDALNRYWGSLPPERRWMLQHYHVVDVAHRVVGVGSVGTRAYLATLFGNSDSDPLFLQVKEAVEPAHARYLPPLPPEYRHNGHRVVAGQSVLQAAHDPVLGYTEIDGRHYYVRQMKNMKGALPMDAFSEAVFDVFAFLFGWLLARAHARSGDAAVILGYCGKSEVLDEAFADWAEAYGDQTEKDHARLVKAVKSGRVAAASEA